MRGKVGLTRLFQNFWARFRDFYEYFEISNFHDLNSKILVEISTFLCNCDRKRMLTKNIGLKIHVHLVLWRTVTLPWLDTEADTGGV